MVDMKVFLSMLALATAYTDIDDNKYATLIGDRIKLKAFYTCMLEQTPCDSFGQHLKGHLTELLSDGCRECDRIQKRYAHVLIIMLKNDYPDLYETFEKKFDPKANILNLDAKTKDI